MQVFVYTRNRLKPLFILVQVRKKKTFTLDAHGKRQEYEGMEVSGGELLEFIRKNKALSTEFCTKLYQELFTPIQLKIEHEIETYTFKQLEVDFDNLNEIAENDRRVPRNRKKPDRL